MEVIPYDKSPATVGEDGNPRNRTVIQVPLRYFMMWALADKQKHGGHDLQRGDGSLKMMKE